MHARFGFGFGLRLELRLPGQLSSYYSVKKKQLSSDEVKSSFNHASPFNLSEILFVGGIWPTSVAFPMLPGVDRIGCYDLIKIQFNCDLTPVLNMNLD